MQRRVHLAVRGLENAVSVAGVLLLAAATHTEVEVEASKKPDLASVEG